MSGDDEPMQDRTHNPTGYLRLGAADDFAFVYLLAAAPEMLAVLERCNNRWDDADEEDDPALGQAIRAVIAKATGRESE